MRARLVKWRAFFRFRSLKILIIFFLIPPPFITVFGATAGILNANKHVDSVVPYIIAGLPFALAGSYFLYAIPTALISLFVLFSSIFYPDRNIAEDASLIVGGIVFGIFFGVISEFRALPIFGGILVGSLSTLLALIATKNLRALNHLDGRLP